MGRGFAIVLAVLALAGSAGAGTIHVDYSLTGGTLGNFNSGTGSPELLPITSGRLGLVLPAVGSLTVQIVPKEATQVPPDGRPRVTTWKMRSSPCTVMKTSPSGETARLSNRSLGDSATMR